MMLSSPAILPPLKKKQCSIAGIGHFYFAQIGHYHFAGTFGESLVESCLALLNHPGAVSCLLRADEVRLKSGRYLPQRQWVENAVTHYPMKCIATEKNLKYARKEGVSRPPARYGYEPTITRHNYVT
jgi:hypothetical protein